MHHRLLRLFETAACSVTPNGAVLLSMALSTALVFVIAANVATASARFSVAAIQDSKPSGTATSRKGSGGSLGAYLGDINEERARELRLSQARGALVGTVEENSPAAKSGLQVNDVILSFNDHQIFNPSQLFKLLSESAAGTSVTLGISRGGALLNKSVVLGQRRTSKLDDRDKLYALADAHLVAAEEAARSKEEAKARGNEKDAARFAEEEKAFRRMADESRASVDKDIQEGKIILSPSAQQIGSTITAARYQLGVRVTPLTAQLAASFNTKGGVLVNEVRVGGAAEQAGIKAGDCITAVNGERVDTLADLNRLVDQTSRANIGQKQDSTSGEATLSVIRERAELSVKVKFNQR